ncbi:MAG TPA: hypothetical protein VNX68_02140 [Nitrosopumilaceae archaeon]|jgi:hypothetical protein|nr:hypothetical protein [Nitrosopumilaceae archaeon]
MWPPIFIYPLFLFLISFCCSGQSEAGVISCNKDSLNNFIEYGHYFDPSVQNATLGINPKCIEYDKQTGDAIHKQIDSVCKAYIIERSGSKLFSKVIDYEMDFKIKDSCSCKTKIKYVRNYSLLLTDTIEYSFFIKFNSHGKIIRDHQIPELKPDQEFRQLIDFCVAFKIAQQDDYFRHEFKGMDLEYSQEFNQFVWCVNTEEIHHAITSFAYSILINAKTGKVVGHRKRKFKVML